MKTSGRRRVKAVGVILALVLLLVLSLTAFTACNEKKVASIEVDAASLEGGIYTVGGFAENIGSIKIIVTYEGDDVPGKIALTKLMLTTESREAIKTVGEKHLTVQYGGKTATLDVELVEDGTEVVCVTFRERVTNTELAKKYAKKGGTITPPDAPLVEGQTFDAWVDSDGKKYDLNNVTESVTLTASYKVNKEKYTIKVFDYKQELLGSTEVNGGEKVNFPSNVKVDLKKYPELDGYTWSVEFPTTITEDTVVYMVPKFKSYSVLFAYAFEDNKTDVKYIESLSEVVTYGTDINSIKSSGKTKFALAEEHLKGLKYEIVTRPTGSTTITANTTFLYIVRDAGITVTVYKDENMSATLETTVHRPGDSYALPSTAPAILGYTFVGWKLVGSAPEVTVEPGKTWEVSSPSGNDVAFVPVYKKDTVSVKFDFVFDEVSLKSNPSEKYVLTVTVADEMTLDAPVTYVYVNDLLNKIVKDKKKYQENLVTANRHSDIYGVKENSSAERNTAFDLFDGCGIIEITVIMDGRKESVTVNQARTIRTSDLTFTVRLNGSTPGLEYTKVSYTVPAEQEGEEAVTKYALAVTGYTGASDVNIYIPAAYKLAGEEEALPVMFVDTDALQGKDVISLSPALRKIGANAFNGAMIFGDYDFADMEVIESGAFESAKIMGSLSFGKVTSLGEGAFRNADFAGNDLTFKGTFGVISEECFYGVKGLGKLTIPESVTEIAAKAFENAEAEAIDSLEKIETVADRAFYGTEFTEMNLPMVKSLGDAALGNMEKLERVSLGANATETAEFNFNALAGSYGVKSITLGAKIISFVFDADIANFTVLSSVEVDAANEKLFADGAAVYTVADATYTLIYYANDRTGSYKVALPKENAALVVDAKAFDYAVVAVLDVSSYSLTVNNVCLGTVYAVVVNGDDDVAKINTAFTGAEVYTQGQDGAFGYDEDSKLIYKTIEGKATVTVVGGYRYATEITVPATLGGNPVTQIANNAFAGFAALEKLKINATLDGWNDTVLKGADKLSVFEVAGFDSKANLSLDDFRDNGWFDSHNVIYVGGILLGYNNDARNARNEAITVVTAEDTVKYFGSYKYKGQQYSGQIPERFFVVGDANANECNLTEIAFDSSISQIDEGAFYGCKNLAEVDLNKVSTIRDRAFYGCSALTEIAFNGVSLGEYAFADCKSLEKAVINGKIEEASGRYYLPVGLFQGCEMLSEFSADYANAFAVNVNGEANTFYGCAALKEFDFSRVVTSSIPGKTFQSTGFTSLDFTVNPNIVSIGEQAFNSCLSLVYVKLSTGITTIASYAFTDASAGLVVEIPYESPSGVYSQTEPFGVKGDSFDGGAKFVVSPSAANDKANNFFKQNPDWTIKSQYPSVSFAFGNSMAGTSAALGMPALNNKVFVTEEDIGKPVIDGYVFVGWYEDQEEVNKVNFPLVLNKDENFVTLYAKFYNVKQGSLTATSDVKYVYYLGSAPKIDLLTSETVEWYLVTDGVASTEAVDAWPLIVSATSKNTFALKAKIRNSDTATDRFVTYENVGSKGYAIVNHTSTAAENVLIPDTYDDNGENGEANIILVYAGAFTNSNLKLEELKIPACVKAIVTGNGTTSIEISAFTKGTTFNEHLKKIYIPSGVEYVADGVFKGLTNLTEIEFAPRSSLLYANVDAFYGSGWYLQQLQNAKLNNGFIIAGCLALEYVDNVDAVIINEDNEYKPTTKLGFVENFEEIVVYIDVYYKDGAVVSVERTVIADKSLTNGVYRYSFNIVGNVNADFAINSEDKSYWTYAYGKNVLALSNPDNEKIIALAFRTAKTTEVTVPAGVVKLNDGIFQGNEDLETIVLNPELMHVGSRAFIDSGLREVRYGQNGSERNKSSIISVGTEAFAGTAWYQQESVILGKLYLKFNNVGASSNFTLADELITSIESSAFENARLSIIDLSAAKNLTSIKAFAFKDSSVTSVVLAKSVTEIGRGAFMGCTALRTADLSETKITALSKDLFNGAKELLNVSLSSSVSSFGENAFNECAKLANIAAGGLTDLEVLADAGASGSDIKFVSGLEQTAWYNPKQAEVDTFVSLGSVLVKFILGSERDLTGITSLSVAIPEGITTIINRAFYNTNFVTEIVVPDSVTKIGGHAFEDCKDLVTVKLGKSVTEIGDSAFQDCEKLQNVVLPDSLKTIGDLAFKGTAITTEVTDEKGMRISDDGFTIPDSVTHIGARAFAGIKTMTIINIGNQTFGADGTLNESGVGSSLVELGERAFDMGDGSRLYKINWNFITSKLTEDDDDTVIGKFGAYIKSYGKNVFGSANPIRFYVSEEDYDYINSTEFAESSIWTETFNWNFNTYGTYPRVQFDSNGYALSPINTEYLKDGDIDVPVHDSSAGNTYTFMGWYKDEAGNTPVEYPMNIYEDITLYAKWYVNEVTVTDSVVIGEDGARLTYNGTRNVITGVNSATIKSVTTDSDTLYIPSVIISGRGSAAISYNVAGIDLGEPNTTVREIILTNASNFNGMTENIFADFVNLRSIKLYNASNEEADFKVVPVEMQATYLDKTYTYTFYALYSNDTAAKDNFGTKLIAFIGNVENASKELLGVKEGTDEPAAILDFVFEIPKGVTEIYPGALINSGLRTVYLPSTVSKVGEYAFGDKLTSLRVDRNIYVTDINGDAIDSNAPIMQAEASSVASTDYIQINGLKSDYKINNSTYGAFYAFANVLFRYETKVTSYHDLTLPSSINGFDITVISSYIYPENSVDSDMKISTRVLTLPEKLRKINANAFSGIDVTESIIYTGNALTDIAAGVFNHTEYYENYNNQSEALILGKILVKWQSAKGAVVVPEGIVSISARAFESSQATEITLPSSVVSIGANAFYAAQLTKINIPNGVTSIGEYAFAECYSLKDVQIDTIKSTLSSIGTAAFRNNKALTELKLPASLRTVGNSAFEGCAKMRSVTFNGYNLIKDEETGSERYELDPNVRSKLELIGSSAFSKCEALTSVSIPDGVTEIKDSAFNSCKSLVTVEFGDNSVLKVIGAQAFANCVKLGSSLGNLAENHISLTTVDLPNSLITVGKEAFKGCEGMWGIQFNYNIYEIGESVFEGCNSLAKVTIYRETAPKIYSDTFKVGNDAKFRLRIYVRASNEVMGEDKLSKVVYNYKEAWTPVWDDAYNHLYAIGDLPTLQYMRNEEDTAPIVERTELVLSPSVSFGGSGKTSTFKYLNLTNKGTEPTNRGRAFIDEYKNGCQVITDPESGIKYTILVVDYDVVQIVSATR